MTDRIGRRTLRIIKNDYTMKKLFVLIAALMATASLSAQDLSTTFNEGAAAYQQKDFVTAAAKFEEIIAQDSEGADEVTAKAKQFLPVCYQNMGQSAAIKQNFDDAAAHLTKAAELAEQFGDKARVGRANAMLVKVYLAQGTPAYNNKDYATAAAIFAKGYAINPRNTEMALNLAASYCESGDYAKGMEVYENIAAMNPDKYGEAIAKAQEMMTLYTNNQVAKMQAANDFDGIIKMADEMLEKNPVDALALSVRLQAYNGKKDYSKVIELGEEAAQAQTTPETKSQMYYLLGAAYNAKEMKPQAVAAFKQVTAGPNAESAKAAVAELSK